jgi:sugar phosphate isomerase/epimerase
MTSRREFVRLSALAAGCVVVFPKSGFGAAYTGAMNYGVQFFMVRKSAPADLSKVLKQIHEAGFTQIELYPVVYTHPAKELKQIVADSGLGLVSAHFNYDQSTMVGYARELGLKYMVCPMLPKEQWESAAGFSKAAKDFNAWGKAAKDQGMTFAFHNHCYEFKPQGNKTGYEILMEGTDPSLVKLELDMYWATQGGQDPAAMLKKYENRIELIHLKDRVAGAPVSFIMDGPQHFTELGKGSIAWKSLIAQAKRQGIKYAFLDQDETHGPVMETIASSHAYLKTLHE